MSGVDLSQIPKDYTISVGGVSGSTISVDSGLDLSITSLPSTLPTINLGEIKTSITSLPPTLPKITLDDINLAITKFPEKIPDVNLNFSLKSFPETLPDSNLNLSIKEIPEIRTHIPANFNFGISVLGFRLVNFCFSGEAQVIVEKYVPHRLELCD